MLIVLGSGEFFEQIGERGRAAVGDRLQGVFDAVSAFFAAWGPRILVVVLVVLGAVLAADGIGWFLGKPLM